MFSFIVENKSANDSSVTGTYMRIIERACSAVNSVEFVLKGEKPSSKTNYIVSDTIQTSLLYFFKGYFKQIVWMQGIVPEESYMRNHSWVRSFVLSCMEKTVLTKSKLVFLVSDAMLKHYETKYHIKLAEKSVIMPCFNETSINRNAFEDNKYLNNSFVYVGGLAKWQCFDKIAELFALLEKETGKKISFYVYTFDQDGAKKILEEKGVANYKVDYASKDNLSNLIKNYKYGFVLRDNNSVNSVATPTKISNYLSNGIIPIYSDILTSFVEQGKKYDLGIVCSVDDLETSALKIENHMNEEFDSNHFYTACQSMFETYYNPELYIEMIQNKLRLLSIQ